MLDGEVKNVFRHIFKHLGPETTSSTDSMKRVDERMKSCDFSS